MPSRDIYGRWPNQAGSQRDATVEWVAKALEEQVPDGSLWLVAELDGEAVGEAQAELHESATNAAIKPGLDAGRRRAYLHYLAVQARHQSRGIGSRLLRAVEEWAAREKGAELVHGHEFA